MIVPDSIEPVIGWKAWEISSNGMLESPNYAQIWKPEQAAEAECRSPHWRFVWELDTESSAEDCDYEEILASLAGAPGHWSSVGPPPIPSVIVPPPGRAWYLRWRRYEHACPSSGCACGIYLAAEADHAAGYGTIIGKVAGWGTVIEGEFGYRVQYAYPTEIYVDSAKQAEKLVDYGVPIVLKEEAPEAIKATSKSKLRYWPVIGTLICALLAVATGVMILVNESWTSIVSLWAATIAVGINFATTKYRI